MRLSYDHIFKYSEIFNPVSSATLFAAGKLAQFRPGKTVLDLGCGKGYPSLLWASVFGVRIEGFDINKNYVEYANSHAKMLNLSHRVKYACEDVRELRPSREYDVVASLGLGIAQVYGDISNALRFFKTMLHEDGVLILAEPAWLTKPIPPEVLKPLGEVENSFFTKSEMQQLMEESGFPVLRFFASSKEDWELYVKPIYVAMHEIIEDKNELAEEAQRVIDGFKAEFNAVGQHWDMILWVAKAH
ncbi:MAG: class I SAM-dependent methyltransferase [Candidatus Bathyarchaeota archaeon]|nr:MAG: class I SAM-dependent methyltransferase [Candidatus Bathyarchaeota archaeon]